MPQLLSTPLHSRYGLRVNGMQLSDVTTQHGYSEIREAFENHSLLYFPKQDFDDEVHLRFGALFGPREDRSLSKDRKLPDISLVSNQKADGTLHRENEKRLLDLQSNMLWHTDSTFLPVPALANILVGRVIPSSGSITEFASTRAAWADMPASLKNRARNIFFRHDYTHSRRKIDPKLAEDEKFTHWGEQIWKSVWRNPTNGEEALYIASHACGVVGMDDDAASSLIDELIEWCTQPQYVYTHNWHVGDVLVWDERALLHRGTPWNYDEPRTLSSICISARPVDGLNTMRMPL